MRTKIQNSLRNLVSNSPVFFLVFLAAMFYVLHGKPWASVLFDQGLSLFTRSFHNIRVYLAMVAVSLLFAGLKASSWTSSKRAIVGTLAAIGGPLGIQLQSTESSPMIFILHLYLCLIALTIVVVEPLFSLDIKPEFWKSFFSVTAKAAGYIFTAFSAGLAVLQYVSRGLHETISSYITSLAYPAGTLLMSIIFVAFWLLAPAWNKYLETIRIDHSIDIAKANG